MTTATQNILTAANLHKYYGKGLSRIHVLRGLNLQVRRGEFLAVMGPSGCGKSTLLHILGLLTPPDDGTILLDGQLMGHNDAALTLARRRRIGFVFQRFNLLSVLTAADNVAISLKVRGLGDPDSHVDELFDALNVSHVAGRKPGQMSIGEQQRVAIVRALAHRPDLLLADEPTGNLDSKSSQELLNVLHKVNQEQGQTIVMITHSPEAAACAHRTVHMMDGQLLDQ